MPTLLDRDFKDYGNPGASKRRSRRRWHILFAIGFIAALAAIALGSTTESSIEAKPLDTLNDTIEIPDRVLQHELSLPADDTRTVSDTDEPQVEPVPVPALVHEIEVGAGDTLSGIFDRLSIPQRELMGLVSFEPAEATMRRLKPGDRIRLEIDAGNRLQRLVHSNSPHFRTYFERTQDGFNAREEKDVIERRPHYAHAVIEDSLFLAATGAGLDDGMTMELATIFGWDIDFALDVRSGDEFSVIYEVLYKHGDAIGYGSILAAEFVNQGKTFRAIRFTDSDDRTNYYTPDGDSVRKAFLRTPVDFARISSRFSLSRKHPVLNRMRAHRGVDYAAPTGTPVRSTGDGKLEFVGTKGGYGKTIIVKHTSTYSTLYAHLSRFKSGMRSGRRVKQGDIIGYVGQTGLASGPHLHYEFRVNGVQRNPLTVALPGAKPVASEDRAAFELAAAPFVAQLDTIKRNRLAMQSAQNDIFD